MEQQNHKSMDFMAFMFSSDCFKDVTLVCDDHKKIKAHRNVLRFFSPFFLKLFAGEGEAVAAPSNCVKEGAVGALPNDNTWRRPDDPVGDGRMLSGLPGTAAGLCFFLRNSSFRLAFLLMVDGLFFFQALSLVTEVGAISLVS